MCSLGGSRGQILSLRKMEIRDRDKKKKKKKKGKQNLDPDAGKD